jgi:hypothetical protein
VPDSPDAVPPIEYLLGGGGGGGGGGTTHVTATLVTFADATVPDPPETVQTSPLGLLATVT